MVVQTYIHSNMGAEDGRMAIWGQPWGKVSKTLSQKKLARHGSTIPVMPASQEAVRRIMVWGWPQQKQDLT
jgi:hypothetical protein